MTIRVRIDRVVIDDGAVPGRTAGFAEALHAELARLLIATPTSVWGQSRHVRHLHATAEGLGAGAGKSDAAALALALHRTLVETAR